jgi:UPF0716 protein FxsA
MVALLFVLFVVAPLVELYVFVLVAGVIGFFPAIAVLLAVSFLGIWLVKREGLGVLRRTQTTLGRGQMPADEVVDGGLLAMAGLLCVVPGFITAVLGLLLLVPPIRRLVRNRLVRRWSAGRGVFASRGFGAAVVDVEYVGDVTPQRGPDGHATELGRGR